MTQFSNSFDSNKNQLAVVKLRDRVHLFTAIRNYMREKITKFCLCQLFKNYFLNNMLRNKEHALPTREETQSKLSRNELLRNSVNRMHHSQPLFGFATQTPTQKERILKI